MAWTLNTLPFELTVQILSHTDFAAIARYRRTSRLSNDLVVTHSAIVYRQLAFAHGLTNSLSASAANLRLQDSSPSPSFDEDELQRVVKSNRTLSDYWDGVRDWEEYCKRRLALETAWREADCVEDLIPISKELDDYLWRFKLDVHSRKVIATGGNGHLYQFDMQGQVDWVHPNPDECAHIEYSEGHIILSSRTGTHTVLRRADIVSPPSFLDSPPSPSYSPFALLHAPHITTATKLRWPFYAAYNPQREEVYMWDLTNLHKAENRPIRTISVHSTEAWGDVVYLDFDSTTLFVARQIGIVDIPFLNPSARPGPRENIGGGDFVAIHHDCRGLVGSVNAHGRIDFSSPLFGQHHIVIPGLRICELAVENGRIAFLALKRWTQTLSLWLIDLTRYRSPEDIIRNPPVPVRLVAFVPSLHPSRRLEMTGDQIFLLADADFSGKNGWLGKAFHERSRVHAESKEQKYSWAREGETETIGKARNRKWTEGKKVDSLEGYDVYDPYDDGQNAMFVLSFGRSAEGRDQFVVAE